MSLPKLLWVPSPNFNSRHGTRADQIIIHDMEGSYAGSIAYFRTIASQVSAHYCVRGDGLEVTQMVHLSDRAWHACAANSRSVGIEMEGYAKNGYKPELLDAMHCIVAFLCHYLQIPVRHARGGVGPGIESHWGLGTAGGGHSDPSTDPQWMETFVAAIAAEYARGDFPASWEADGDAKPCPLDHAHAPIAAVADRGPGSMGSLEGRPSLDGLSTPATAPMDLSTVEGIQRALVALGAKIAVDGINGPETVGAIKAFQGKLGLGEDGVFGPMTEAAIAKSLRGR